MAGAGGCADGLDPTHDARDARPCWLAAPATAALWVRNVRDLAAVDQPRFDLWRIAGRKRLLLHHGGELALTARWHSRVLSALFAEALVDGAAYDCAVPWHPGLRARLEDVDVQARMLAGEPPRPVIARGATRAGLLHLRALQAHDAARSGASQRDIAQVLFGDLALAGRWHADGELRAQVRHLLRRARALVAGGYLALAGATAAAKAGGGDPGDGRDD